MVISTKKFSEFASGGDLENDNTTVGLKSNANAQFNNPWVFLPPGTTAERPAIAASMYYRLRLNTTLESYEYYSSVAADWVQIEDSGDLIDAPYVIYKADATLPAAFDLGLLSTGLLKISVSGAVATPTIGVNGVDFYGPGYTGAYTAPSGIKDINSLDVVAFESEGASSVNYLILQNNTTTNPPEVRSAGTDTHVGLVLKSQLAGVVSLHTTLSSSAIEFATGTGYQHTSYFTFADTAASREITWQDASGTVAYLSDVAGAVTSAEGTQYQVLVNGNSGTQETGDIVLTLPQDIATTSSPTFDAIIATGALTVGSGSDLLTLNSSTAIDGVIDDDTMATAAATNVPTSESIKAYVDGLVGSAVPAAGTAGVVLRSDGADWQNSSFTLAASYAPNDLIYCSSTNNLSALTAVNNASFSTNASGVPTWLALTDGQVVVGSSAGAPLAATLTAGTGVIITNAANSITVASTGGGMAWSNIGGTTQAAAVDNGYISDDAGATTITLPATAAIGSKVGVEGLGAGGWILAASAGDTIQIGSGETSSGGTLTSSAATDSVYVLCIVANTTWRVITTNSAGLIIA